jgi:AraC-like DNA-binding protein
MVDWQCSAPHPSLRPFVRRYAQRILPIGSGLNEPVAARLGAMLEFQFASLYRIPIWGTDRHERCAPIIIVGPITHRRVQLHADGSIEALSVLFRPHGLRELFGIPTHLIAERGCDAPALMGNGIASLYEKLGNVRTFAERVGLLDAFLLPRCSAWKPDAFSQALGLFARDGHATTIAELASATGISVRQLERKALDYAGMTPQMAMRVARFQRALHLHSTRPMTWTDVAYAAGYYDQMHMVRDFRRFAGMTPTELARQIQPHYGVALMS